ncbi:general substrate transporter [Aspergillus granulosus]|uniref:General substrate transporter n=1 Tax=Aspergillus granulosus TaxID=176169 RepID=A0ABR4GVS8_9EURO
MIFMGLVAFFLFGYNQSNLGGVLDYPSFTKHFPTIDTSNTEGAVKDHNATVQGTVVAVYTLGCLIGALEVTQLGNRFGRRKSLIVSAAIATAGLTIQTSSCTLGQLVVGRIVSGVGNGGVNAIVPVWRSECTKPKSRGKIVVIIGIFIASGIAVAGWVNVGLSYVEDNELAWRLPLAIPIVFTLPLMTLTMTFPESPRWLVSKGRREDAQAAMKALTGKEETTAEMQEMQWALQQPSTSERGFVDLFKLGPQRLFYRLCLAVGINFYAQMTGANVISYYGKTIFRDSLGLEGVKASFLNAGVLTWKIFAATSAYLSVDRFGRKPLFITACLGMGLSMAGLAGIVWAIENRDTLGASIAATFFLFFYMTFFPLGFLGANFLYSAEIAPQDLRMHLAAVGTATHWLFNFVIAEITPIAFATIKYHYYIVYAVIRFSASVIVYYFFPESKGRPLEEMDRLFSEPEAWWRVTVYARIGREPVVEDKGKHGVEHFETISSPCT